LPASWPAEGIQVPTEYKAAWTPTGATIPHMDRMNSEQYVNY